MNDKLIIGLGAALTIIILGAIVLSGGKSALPESEPKEVDKAELVREHSHSIGAEGAKVTIVEFGDFQCPACRSTEPVLKQLLSEYSSDARLVFRHLPLNGIHPHAEEAARAAEAAAEQGKFWEYHDMLYANQEAWSGSSNIQTALDAYATELGLNLAKFQADYTSSAIIDRISYDKGDAKKLEINSTPTIYINGEKLTEAPSYEIMKSEIDTILER